MSPPEHTLPSNTQPQTVGTLPTNQIPPVSANVPVSSTDAASSDKSTIVVNDPKPNQTFHAGTYIHVSVDVFRSAVEPKIDVSLYQTDKTILL